MADADPKEQIRRILRLTCHYEVLCVQKTASSAEIKASWKKLTRLLHPDKCKEPSAEDAFKRLTSAYEILNDPEKRRRYDLQKETGIDENVFYARANPFGQHAYYTNFDGAEDPTEVLLRAFFMGAQPRFRVYTQPRYHPQHQQQHRHFRRAERQADAGNFSSVSLLTLLLLLLSILLPILTSGGGRADPAYSFVPVQGADQQRHTYAMKAPYYVGKDFDLVGSALRYFEDRVEAGYVEYLQRYCQAEMSGRVKPADWCPQYRDARAAYYRSR